MTVKCWVLLKCYYLVSEDLPTSYDVLGLKPVLETEKEYIFPVEFVAYGETAKT